MIISIAKQVAESIGVDIKAVYQELSALSIRAAVRAQGLSDLLEQCRKIIPDIADQYTERFAPAEYERYWELKIRAVHAFQVRCMLESLNFIVQSGARTKVIIVDIGDSSGNHGMYAKALAPAGIIHRIISVNLDPVAVEKIRRKGGEAILCRAEELNLGESKVDMFMCFETMEHLTDPTRFLHRLAASGNSEYLLMSVPYRKVSRVGLDALRRPTLPTKMSAEWVHIFELCPEDWLLLARFAGWTPKFTWTYRQYPRYSPLALMAPLWRKLDFEGFIAMLLKRDLSVAERYQDW